MAERERGGGYCEGPESSKAILFHSCLKALFFVSLRATEAVLKQGEML